MIQNALRALSCAPVLLALLGTAPPAQEPVATEGPSVAQEPEPPKLSLSLEEALGLALRNNLGLRIEDSATEIARFNALGSWGEFDWVLGATTRYTDFERKPSAVIEGGVLQEGDVLYWDVSLSRALETGGSFQALFTSNRTTTTSFNAPVPRQFQDELTFSLTQPLLRGVGVDRATSEQRESEILFLQQLERRRQVQQELLSDTSNAYWTLVQTQNQLGVAESSLGLGLEQLERNRRLLSAGVGTEVEVIQAEAEVARREETKLLADVTQRIAGDALKALIYGEQETAAWDTILVPTTMAPEDVTVNDLPSWEQVLAVATENRPDITQQRDQIKLAELRLERAISDRRVGLDLNLSMVSQGLDTEWEGSGKEAIDFQHMSYVGGLSLNAPVQNRTAIHAESAARMQVVSARAGLKQLEMQVISEVRDAVRQLRYQSLAVRAAGESLRAADRQLAAEEARYENDLSTNFQVLEFQMQLVEAMNSLQTARVNFAKALYQLRKVQGILGDRP